MFQMQKWQLLACSAALMIGTVPAAQAQTACPAEGTASAEWIGLSQLHGGKGYADTPMGQVHYRLAGEGEGPVIVLLHQTPWSMVQYAEVQACLAERGVRSLAIDTPGYGMSDMPGGHPTIAQYADNLIPVLDKLGLDRVILAGHHTGASIAASFASRHPDRTAGLLMHGTPLYSRAERETRLSGTHRTRDLSEDGSHLSEYYAYIRNYAGPNPRTRITANWSTITWWLSGVADVAHEAVYLHDLGEDLDRVIAPTMIFSDAQDSLHVNDQRAAALKPWFGYTQFSEGGAHAMMIDPARWARLAARFVGEVADGSAPAGD
ncbi:alpha/beta hydrolase [Stakelama tenebrarum]|uniref:Alpha/beta hydrolase n=1 Tax=Stakelama tenebrarum TaxID=2711215 RepID=A0A6G6Y1T3_9SPHN|nr:alpha/beta hydrolase [Sphingosinithalassobacter tenebrarum]QIG78859.1 alpha/beta hydrolase [Sphingosinithalassobacter tenebrarum]